VNKAPFTSRFDLDDTVSVVFRTLAGEVIHRIQAVVYGVQFTEGKVHYLVEFEDGKQFVVDSCDVEEILP
jgi:hypothetical protein